MLILRLLGYRTITPLAVKVLRRAAKDILMHADTDLAQTYATILETAILTHPAVATQLITPLSKLFVLALTPTQARERLLSLVRAIPLAVWSWYALGEVFAPDDPDNAVACFAKVLSLSPTPSRTMRTREHLLNALMSQRDTSQYTYAKFEALLIQEDRKERNWRIKPPLLRHIQTLRDVLPASDTDQKAFYQRYASKADALIL